MSKAKFTKGPWVADIRGGCCAVYTESREGDTKTKSGAKRKSKLLAKARGES